jgi:hypothetical protein
MSGSSVPVRFAAAALALTVWFAITAGAAAAQVQICGNGGSGYCMNDWGNGGSLSPVKMYYGNSSNESFGVIPVDPCHDGGTVNSTCPFTSRYLDSYYAGDPVLELEYAPKGLCVGTTGSGTAELAGCGNSYANGAGDGTIVVNVGSGNLVDRYWTNRDDESLFVCSSGRLGGPLEMNYVLTEPYGGCDWGGLFEIV